MNDLRIRINWESNKECSWYSRIWVLIECIKLNEMRWIQHESGCEKSTKSTLTGGTLWASSKHKTILYTEVYNIKKVYRTIKNTAKKRTQKLQTPEEKWNARCKQAVELFN